MRQGDLGSKGRRLFLLSVASVLPVGSGCIHGEDPSQSEEGPEDVEDRGPDAPEELPYSTFDVIHAEDGSLVAFEMVNHWHFHPIEVEVDGRLPVWFRADLSEIDGASTEDLDDRYVEVEVQSGDPASFSVDEVEDTAGELAIEGESAGEVEVVFAVVDGSGDVEYRTEPVPLHVNES